jgi:radical SAM protein with 4Fe4S-binding SPASM domain
LEGWKKAGDFRVGDRAFVRVRLWPPSETIQADLEQVLQESPAKNGSLLEGQGRAVASFGKSDTGFCIADLKLERNLEPRTVDSVQVIRKHTIVYSFSCAPVHAFVANGFVVHNCAYKSSFSGMHELSPDRESTWDGPVAELPTAKLLEVLDDFRDMGVKAVTYSGGGEPLMHPAIVTVMERTLELGIHLSIITNGQLLMAERAKTLGRAKWVRVSVDYQNAQQMHEHRHVPERMFGALLNNLQNFARLKQPQCDLYLNYIVHKGNCESLTEAARLFFEVGVENIRFSPVWTPDFQAYHAPIRARVEQQLLEIRQSLRLGQTVNTTYDLASSAHSIERGYHRCFFMEMVPVVAADGNVYACHNKAYDAKGMIGTIRDKRFKALWFSPEAKEFFKTLDPTVMCRHQCANDGKNLFIHQLLASHGDNFV